MRRHPLAFLCVIGLAALVGSAAPVAGAADACPNGAIRSEQRSTFLPECRAYEQVSPTSKGGVDVLGDTQRPFTKAGPDGNSLAYSSSAAFGDVDGAAFPSIYRAVRAANGWVSGGVSPPQNATVIGGLGGGNTSVVSWFDSTLTAAIVRTNRSLDPGAGEDFPNFYRRDLLGGGYELLSPGGPPGPEFTSTAPEFAWTSPDLSVFSFASREALTPDAPVNGLDKAYVSRNGVLELASVLPGDIPVAGFPGDKELRNTMGSVSDDGSRAFFVGREGGEAGGEGLYLRDLDADTTTEIVDPSVQVRYLAGSSDGSKVLWKATDPGPNVENLFLYDVASETTTVLPDTEPVGVAYGVTSALAANADLSSIYFTAKGALVAGQPVAPGGDALGIYRWQPLSGVVTFVGYLEGGSSSWNRLQFEGGVFDSLPTRRDIATTQSGSVLAFVTDAEVVTGSGSVYDNSSPEPACDDGGEEQCAEVYRFDAGADTLECVSCPQGGPVANATLPGGSTVGPTSTINQSSFAQANAVSADGSKTFFETGERLTAGDTNGRVDVYMLEGGIRELLSSGSSQYNSRLLDASPSGDDVFIVTRARMVGWDRDDLADVYDIRVGGGFPEPPPSLPGCLGSDCQGAGSKGPEVPGLGSRDLVGPGNAKACRKAAADAKRLSARAREMQGRADRQRARAAQLSARSKDASGSEARALAERSQNLARSAGKASRQSQQLNEQARKVANRGSSCRGGK